MEDEMNGQSKNLGGRGGIGQNPHGRGVDGIVIDDLFGKIFGIERVHILKKTDRLIDVLEKICLVPESKLVFVEENPNVGSQELTRSFSINNILTLGDLFTYFNTNVSGEGE